MQENVCILAGNGEKMLQSRYICLLLTISKNRHVEQIYVVQVVVVVCRHEIRTGRSGVTYSLCTMVTMVFYDI